MSATLAIYDTMQFLECPIATYCMGLAASGAAILLAAGTKGKRFALPNSKIMIHQPYGQVGGQVSDIEIQATEILKEHERLNEILANHTGQPIEMIAKETDRDRYFTAEEAKEFGLVDDVLAKPDRGEEVTRLLRAADPVETVPRDPLRTVGPPAAAATEFITRGPAAR